MKTIFDIYDIEECCNAACANPSNTVGIGNPMPPGEGQVGSEPMTGKCKKEKSKKRKCSEPWTEPVVKEGILDNIETNFAKGDDLDKLIQFIEWYVDNQAADLRRINKDLLRDSYMTAMHLEDKNTVVIDIAKDDSSFANIMTVKDALPGHIKTIKIYNCKHEFIIQSYIGDLSNVDIEVYRDNGKSFGNIAASFKSRAGEHLRFGKLVCSDFELRCMAETLTISNDSIILSLNTSASSSLTNIYGKLSNVDDALLNHKLVKTQLCQSGFLPWGCKLTVK